MFSRIILKLVTRKVCLESGILNKWPSKLFRDLLNMAFTKVNGKKSFHDRQKFKILMAILRSSKDCGDANH